jgi:hypothetical protein
MTSADARLLLGAGVILLAISQVNGFLIETLPLVRLALSAHLVGLMGSGFLIGLGASWPALELPQRTSRIAALAAVYGFCSGRLLLRVGMRNVEIRRAVFRGAPCIEHVWTISRADARDQSAEDRR